VNLQGLPAGAPALYLLGLTPADIDLGPLGLPGCRLNVQLPALGTIQTVANSAGQATVSYALPDHPLFLGDVFSQWFTIDAAAAQPVRATTGTRHQVR
jgi:surfactin synthase thioesterase subunit